ncbi:MAG: hypothetical protein EOP85_20565, partial [Verrucomicrobiaceae bacterium]
MKPSLTNTARHPSNDESSSGRSPRPSLSRQISNFARKWVNGSVLAATVFGLGTGISSAATLSNGQLVLNVRNDNGAIDNAILNGKDFFDYGTHVSDWGFQNGTSTGSFVINTTTGSATQPVSVTSTSTSVTVTGTYTAGGSNVAFSRVYRLVSGVNALTITTTLTNNAASAINLRYFDTFDPDQGGSLGLGTETYNDVLVSGGIRVARASATNDLSFTIGSIYGEESILASGGPFQ